jgi:elongation factor P
MIKAGQIDQGMFLLEKGEPYAVVEREFVNPGKGSAFVRLKLKHVVSGSVLKPTYKTQDTVEECVVEDHDCQYLYSDGENYHFMDSSTYEQFEVPAAGGMEDKGLFMKDGETYRVVFWEGKPIDIKIPYKVVYEVTEAEDAVKGDTVTGATKVVKVETGLSVKVPIFIKQGERIMVNTETREYVERVNN